MSGRGKGSGGLAWNPGVNQTMKIGNDLVKEGQALIRKVKKGKEDIYIPWFTADEDPNEVYHSLENFRSEVLVNISDLNNMGNTYRFERKPLEDNLKRLAERARIALGNMSFAEDYVMEEAKKKEKKAEQAKEKKAEPRKEEKKAESRKEEKKREGEPVEERIPKKVKPAGAAARAASPPPEEDFPDIGGFEDEPPPLQVQEPSRSTGPVQTQAAFESAPVLRKGYSKSGKKLGRPSKNKPPKPEKVVPELTEEQRRIMDANRDRKMKYSARRSIRNYLFSTQQPKPGQKAAQEAYVKEMLANANVGVARVVRDPKTGQFVPFRYRGEAVYKRGGIVHQ